MSTVHLNGKKRKRSALFISVVTVAVMILGFGTWYVNDYYEADMEAIEQFVSERSASGEIQKDHMIVFEPQDAETGLIFYPGGKVEHSAYVPLMQACAEQGILCVIVEMPFHLAVLDMNAADGIQEQYPQITKWYIGGHSLGGSMAAAYLEKHIEDYEGLVLLGSYSTADLSDEEIQAVSVYGSEDGVLNLEKYKKYVENLPDDFEEMVIEGGCHAYFGMYGEQEGDGIPSITNEEQIRFTAEKIVQIMKER